MINEPSYSIPDEASDWAARIEAACKIVEEEFGVKLNKASSYQEGRPPIDLADHVSFLRKKAKTKTKWLSIYSGSGLQRTPSGLKNINYYSVGGCSYANKGVYTFGAQFPEVDADKHESLLVKLGDALAAYSAQFTPIETAKRFYLVQWCWDFGTKITKEEVKDLTSEEKLLPLLLGTWYAGLESPLQPHWLGWLNYWSQDVANYLGFPDARRDRDLLRNSYRTPAGAWLVKVGTEPLDAAKPEHVALVADVYKRFPLLGARPKAAPHFFQRAQQPVAADHGEDAAPPER